MWTAFDHVVIGVRDLGAATGRYAQLFARSPSWCGEHPGAGTRNTLFRLDNAYVELMTPSGDGAVGRALAAMMEARGEGVAALAFATDDADACAEVLRERGLAAGDPEPGAGRDEASGAFRHWRRVPIPLADTRGLVLFGIEHRSPADALPLVAPDGDREAAPAALDHVVVLASDLDASSALYGRMLGLRLALDRRFDGRGIRILFFRVGGVTVEVVGAIDAKPDPLAGDRFGGLAYRVGDAEAAKDRLARRGFDVSPVRDGAKPGTRVCTVRDGTWGVPTILVEPAVAATRPAG